MKTRLTFWQIYIGVIIKPLSTFQRLEEDDRAALKGAQALLLVLGAYTLILAIFVMRNNPAIASFILPIGLFVR